jgi:micrococcal nuclease
MFKITILLLLLTASYNVCATIKSYDIELISCYDGDTCTVNLVGVDKVWGYKRKIRLLGIDTPEMRGAAKLEAIKARDALLYHLHNKKLRIEIDENKPRDNFGRLLAVLHADKVNINLLMLELGLAKQYVK